MKKLTSVTQFVTGEGMRISYTFSEIDENGNLISQNNKGNFIVMDEQLLSHITAVNDYVASNKLTE